MQLTSLDRCSMFLPEVSKHEDRAEQQQMAEGEAKA